MRIFMMVFVGAGLLACAKGIWTLVASWRFSRRAQEAEGVVTDMVECRSRSSSSAGMLVDGAWTGGGSSMPTSIYYPVVSFRAADGRKVETRTMTGTSFKGVREGDRVTVLYDPHHPSRAQLERSGGLVILIGMAQCLLGAAFCAMAFFFRWSLSGFGSLGR